VTATNVSAMANGDNPGIARHLHHFGNDLFGGSALQRDEDDFDQMQRACPKEVRIDLIPAASATNRLGPC
jgi:hypothetical protein